MTTQAADQPTAPRGKGREHTMSQPNQSKASSLLIAILEMTHQTTKKLGPNNIAIHTFGVSNQTFMCLDQHRN